MLEATQEHPSDGKDPAGGTKVENSAKEDLDRCDMKQDLWLTADCDNNWRWVFINLTMTFKCAETNVLCQVTKAFPQLASMHDTNTKFWI